MTGQRAAVAQQSDCGAPAEIGDGWRIAKPGEVGIEGARICAMTGWLDGFAASNIHSVLVARHGALAFEHYRNGFDQTWDQPVAIAEHGPAIKHDLRSATKSVTALLIGIALDRKLIPSIDCLLYTSDAADE